MLVTKIIGMYLPQYHRIPENDKWWGEGYTDWIAVQKASPLFKNHLQPRVPLNSEYYDLSDINAIKWQVNLAEKYGIYGFGIYHYWFSSNQVLLDKPANIIKDNKELYIHYFFMWDNGNWKRTWSNVKFSNSWAPTYESNEKEGPEILAELQYGDEEEWKKHFEYLLPFFKDERYIKIDGKPLFGIFNQNNNNKLLERMITYWNNCAIQAGFCGLTFIGKRNIYNIKVTDYEFDYEPATHGWNGKNIIQRAVKKLHGEIALRFGLLKKYSYKKIWNGIIRDFETKREVLPGAFARYDDTPRRGRKASIIVGDTPELFEKYFTKLLQLSKEHGKEYVFLTAWNEWGEGAYLEPDTRYGTAYLEAVKHAVDNVNGKEKV